MENIPENIRCGFKLAKRIRLQLSKELDEKYISTFALKTSLFYILYENRHKRFKTDNPIGTTDSAIFWAGQIVIKLEEIFSAPLVDFERFHDKLAREISGRSDLQYSKICEHDKNHTVPNDRQCCQYVTTSLYIINCMKRHLSRETSTEIVKYNSQTNELEIIPAWIMIMDNSLLATDVNQGFSADSYFAELEDAIRSLFSDTPVPS